MIDPARLARIEAALAAGDPRRASSTTRARWSTSDPGSPQARSAPTCRCCGRGRAASPTWSLAMFPPPPLATHGASRLGDRLLDRPREVRRGRGESQRRFAGHAFEVVGIHDARSLAEAFDRGAANARRRSPDLRARRHRAASRPTSRRACSRTSSARRRRRRRRVAHHRAALGPRGPAPHPRPACCTCRRPVAAACS